LISSESPKALGRGLAAADATSALPASVYNIHQRKDPLVLHTWLVSRPYGQSVFLFILRMFEKLERCHGTEISVGPALTSNRSPRLSLLWIVRCIRPPYWVISTN
jgi:hypothetical protein